MKYHIKALLLVNIIITSAILYSRGIYDSVSIFICGLIAMCVFYDLALLKKFITVLLRFKYLFLSLLLFQILLRRTGDTLLEYSILKITDEGVIYAVNSLMRLLVILLSATMLGSASPYKLIQALRTWRVPEIIILVVSFTITFLRKIQNDVQILLQNIQKRNITFRSISLYKKIELASCLIVPILSKLFYDLHFYVIAMEQSGYRVTGFRKSSTGYNYIRCQMRDYILIACFVIMLVCYIAILLK
jgi:energy-coupling factor transport system permease protein